METKKSSLIMGVVMALFAGAACSSESDATDDTPGTGDNDNAMNEPTREQRITSIAAAACARYADAEAGCPGYGTASDQPYQTENDCLRDFEDRAGELWPSNSCSNGRINDAKYRTCEDRAKVVACSQGLWDAIAALEECSAGEVCSDPANQ